MTNTYRIKQVDGEFVVQEQRAPGKKFKLHSKHTTLDLAKQELQLIEKLDAMTDEELFACLSFNQ